MADDPSADGAVCGAGPKESWERSSRAELLKLLIFLSSSDSSLTDESGLKGSAVCSFEDVESSSSVSSDEDDFPGKPLGTEGIETAGLEGRFAKSDKLFVDWEDAFVVAAPDSHSFFSIRTLSRRSLLCHVLSEATGTGQRG